jgi:hypothetical protein
MPSVRAVTDYLTGCAYIISCVLLVGTIFGAVYPAAWLAGLVVGRSGVGFYLLALAVWSVLVYALVWVFLRVWNPDK